MVYIVQNKEELDQKISEAGEKLIVIDFFANWCGPCKIIAPKLEELSTHYGERAMVLKVNVDDNEEIAVEYNITSMPTFVFIKHGQVIEIFVGGNSDKLVKSMEKYVDDKAVPVPQGIESREMLQDGEEEPANEMEPIIIEGPTPIDDDGQTLK